MDSDRENLHIHARRSDFQPTTAVYFAVLVPYVGDGITRTTLPDCKTGSPQPIHGYFTSLRVQRPDVWKSGLVSHSTGKRETM